MVRLKGIWKNADGINVRMFQFQNGTIKSIQHCFRPGLSFSFQFQNGTIKSIFQLRFVGDNNRFNSKMVRLKVIK